MTVGYGKQMSMRINQCK